MNVEAYPLRTEPFFRDYLWGGRKLQAKLGKNLPSQGVWAESWELIDHPEHQSVIRNGPLAGKTLGQIAATAPEWLLGRPLTTGEPAPNGDYVVAERRQPSGLSTKNTEGKPEGSHPAANKTTRLGTKVDGIEPAPSIPLLLKYLDCQRVLSVQVHPDDSYARTMTPPDLGKTEAWYIIDAEPSGVLYAGLKQGVTQDQLQGAIEQGTVESCLHEIRPVAGDCVFIPAGTVHALGAGLLVAEIQQASNTTFRLFDWNRVDANGQPRQLHVKEALEVIDFDRGPCDLQVPQTTDQAGRMRLVSCDKFVFDRLSGQDEVQLAGDGRFHFLTAPHGGIELQGQGSGHSGSESTYLDVGDSVLIPAAMGAMRVRIDADAVLLDMYVP